MGDTRRWPRWPCWPQPEERTNLTRTRRVNPAADDAFLQGNFYLHRGIRGTQQSIAFFKQAIALDPLQAEVPAGLAEALCLAFALPVKRTPKLG